MTQTPSGFEDNAVPLLGKDTHPLLIERIALCARLGEIMLDEERYNSFEWFDVISAISEVTRQIREQNVDTSRFHSSIDFPMRHNPAAAVVRGKRAALQSFNTPPPEPIDLKAA
jgi:hypothetical protein